MKFLHLIWSNLKRKKLRTTFTVLSILIAFILYCVLSAVETAFSQGIEMAGVDRLIVRHKVSLIQMLPESYQARMEKIPGVAEVAHATWFGGYFREQRNFFPQHPVNPEEWFSLFPEMILSENQMQAWLRTRTGAIVGRKTAERFDWKVGDRVPIFSTIWPKKGGNQTWEFEIVGIFDGAKKGTDTTPLFFRYDYFDEARAELEGQVGWFTVRVADPDEAVAVSKRIDEEFANSPYETKAETEGAFIQGFANQMGNIGAIMASILSTVFFTILMVAGNTMAQAVRERIVEIGVLKAIGFTNGKVLTLILAESFFLAGLGGGIGLTIGWFLTSAGDPTNGMLPMFYLPVSRIWIGILLVIILGLITGLLPAMSGMRLRISDAMRRH